MWRLWWGVIDLCGSTPEGNWVKLKCDMKRFVLERTCPWSEGRECLGVAGLYGRANLDPGSMVDGITSAGK